MVSPLHEAPRDIQPSCLDGSGLLPPEPHGVPCATTLLSGGSRPPPAYPHPSHRAGAFLKPHLGEAREGFPPGEQERAGEIAVGLGEVSEGAWGVALLNLSE